MVAADVRWRAPIARVLALHPNLAAARLKLGEHGVAREAATAALLLSHTDLEARRRRVS